MNGLAVDRNVVLLDRVVPAGMPAGDYRITAGLFPPGTVPQNMEDGERSVIEGYFDQEIVSVR
jgi:hypothetical protein